MTFQGDPVELTGNQSSETGWYEMKKKIYLVFVLL